MRILQKNLMVTFRILCLCLIGCLIIVLVLTLFPIEESSCRHSELLPGMYILHKLTIKIEINLGEMSPIILIKILSYF